MERLHGLDVLKGAAIVFVVLNHACVWPMRTGDVASAFVYGTAFWTVAAFSAVGGYVHGLHPPRDERAVLHKRAIQLIVPWAFWAPLYAMAPFVWRYFGGGALPIGFDPGAWALEVALGGGPLWFLPVLYVVTVICGTLDRRTASWWPAVAGLTVYAALALPASFAGTSPLDVGNGTFWAVAPLYVTAFWFGLRTSRDGVREPGRSLVLAVVVLTVLASGIVTVLRTARTDQLMWLPYALGLVSGCAALLLAVGSGGSTRSSRRTTGGGRASLGPLGRALERAGRSSLGIYVLHPVLIGPAALVAHGRGSVWLAAVVALGATALLTVAVERAREVPVIRRIV